MYMLIRSWHVTNTSAAHRARLTPDHPYLHLAQDLLAFLGGQPDLLRSQVGDRTPDRADEDEQPIYAAAKRWLSRVVAQIDARPKLSDMSGRHRWACRERQHRAARAYRSATHTPT